MPSALAGGTPSTQNKANLFRIEYCVMRIAKSYLKKQSVRQAKLVQFSRYESCPAKVSRPAGMNMCVS